MPPHLFTVRPLPCETLRPRKITSSASAERVKHDGNTGR